MDQAKELGAIGKLAPLLVRGSSYGLLSLTTSVNATLEAVVRRDRLVIVAALIVVIALSWA